MRKCICETCGSASLDLCICHDDKPARQHIKEIEMVIQKPDEPRIEYLTRVLHELMSNTIAGEQVINYDETTCDGMCLANDFASELEMLELL